MSGTAGAAIDRAHQQERAALIIYLPVGFPSVERSVAAAQAAIAAGADVIELGLPYSDPGMDGPVIAAAAQQALRAGTRTDDVVAAVRAISGNGAAILVMSYYNPIFKRGVARMAAELAGAGGAGLITPDLIPEEAQEWIAAADTEGLDKVFLVAPSSTPQRLQLTAAASRGFVYATAVMGVTGTREQVGAGAKDLVLRTRAAGAERVCVGVGVSTPAQAREVAGYADGVIVGSAVVRALHDGQGDADGGISRVFDLVSALRGGVELAGLRAELPSWTKE